MGNNEFLLSVIIPVYNMEKYLQRCVQSVLSAQIPQMQVILVDDGSTDASPAMCDKYAAEHSNFVVVHQENGGLSAARNTGMKHANGEYIFFLDSDDAVDCELFAKFRAFESGKDYTPDLVLCNATFVHVVTGKHIPMNLNIDESEMDGVSGLEALQTILTAKPDFEWHCWRYFYRRAYITQQGLEFPVGRCYEDVKWTPDALAKAQCVAFMPAVSVLYTFGRADSIVNTVSAKKVLDKLVICSDACQLAKQNIADEGLRRMLLQSVGELYISAFRNYCYGAKGVYSYLKEYAYLLQHSQSRFGKLLRKFTKLFGFRMGSLLTKLALKLIDARR